MLSDRTLAFMRGIKREIAVLWILALVFLAGLLNATGFLEFGQTLSHMTGNLTKLGFALSGSSQEPAWLFVLMVASFFLGATLSGYGFPEHRLGQWRRSGLVVLLAGVLLLIMELLIATAAVRIAAMALVLGAQNGLALRYQGILTRTTHMTGHLTDCGAALGRILHQKTWRGPNVKLFFFHLSCLVFFVLGALFTGFVVPSLEHSLSISAVTVAGIAYVLLGAGTLWRGVYAR